jgi:hypothetical protein
MENWVYTLMLRCTLGCVSGAYCLAGSSAVGLENVDVCKWVQDYVYLISGL